MDFLMALGSIIVLDIVLGGDNAVVIAMASRDLPQSVRKKLFMQEPLVPLLVRMLMTLAVWVLTNYIFTGHWRHGTNSYRNQIAEASGRC